jgi:hypothetical protein
MLFHRLNTGKGDIMESALTTGMKQADGTTHRIKKKDRGAIGHTHTQKDTRFVGAQAVGFHNSRTGFISSYDPGTMHLMNTDRLPVGLARH